MENLESIISRSWIIRSVNDIYHFWMIKNVIFVLFRKKQHSNFVLAPSFASNSIM